MRRFDGSVTEDGINENTYNLLFKTGPFYIREESKSDNEFILKLIESFTLCSDLEERFFLSKDSIIERENDGYIIDMGDRKIFFSRMDHYVDSETALELRTTKRYGKCCTSSMNFALQSEKKCSVMIGYIHYSELKMIHAVFVEKYPYGDIVYDYTKNFVMNKEDFEDVTEFELINEIDGNDIKEDFEYLRKIGYIPSKTYLLYRDEIMKDLKKNKKVFKLEKVN